MSFAGLSLAQPCYHQKYLLIMYMCTLRLKLVHQKIGFCADDEWVACMSLFDTVLCVQQFTTQAVLGSMIWKLEFVMVNGSFA